MAYGRITPPFLLLRVEGVVQGCGGCGLWFALYPMLFLMVDCCTASICVPEVWSWYMIHSCEMSGLQMVQCSSNGDKPRRMGAV